jgi:ferrochelatase
VVFVTHSIPVAMDETAGPSGGGYTAMHRDVCEAVAARVSERRGRTVDWDLVYCSRSGPPQQPWLEPDVNDHLEDLSGARRPGCRRRAGRVRERPHGGRLRPRHRGARDGGEAGAAVRRAATAGTDPRFVAGLVDLLLERAGTERGESPDRPAAGRLGPWHDVCPAGCCPNLRAESPPPRGPTP